MRWDARPARGAIVGVEEDVGAEAGTGIEALAEAETGEGTGAGDDAEVETGDAYGTVTGIKGDLWNGR